ncbi:YhcN/YlaJ family sporulation lipoprotein [Alkalihalobacillus macyae]|uniref:YhcN/YlaJ family sporulation lipoprotein n=1 Tax=Guptibacillus hwajinpoensis TaxID=208199 RepID=UPI00273C589B|nr:YhcN/YlaJ family sporulation lipoprotein [Alkalihalobacillus macyae]MDP4550433.1 YhcN/YlaJ family sporulation lipoprotein [Alkalihalobacillus macyae]
MRKSILTLSTMMLAGGLIGCTADDEAMDTRYNDSSRPIGYYTSEDNNGDYREGAVTDMIDRDYANGVKAPDKEQMDRRNGMNGPGYMRTDDNYSGYDNELSNRLSDRIEKLKNVDDARVIVYGDQIMIAVDTNDRNDADVKDSVRSEVAKVTKQKNISISTDEDVFGRMGDVNNRLEDGNGFEEVQSDVNGILNDIGNAAKRPFENNK